MYVGDFPLTTLVETTRLASLTFDSALESVPGLRSGSGQPRVLIFTAGAPVAGTRGDGRPRGRPDRAAGAGGGRGGNPGRNYVRVEADDIGLFDFAGLPRGQVRLRCQTPDGNLVTDWVCL